MLRTHDYTVQFTCRNHQGSHCQLTRNRILVELVGFIGHKNVHPAGYTRLARIRRMRVFSSMLIGSSFTVEEPARHAQHSSDREQV